MRRLLLSLLLCVGCSPNISDVVASDGRIEWTGRTAVTSTGAVRFAWPATQLRLQFEGTSLRASIEDQALPDAFPQLDWLAVELDGVVRDKLPLRAGRHDYTLVAKAAEGSHTLLLTKRTEAEVGTVTVHAIHQDARGKLAAAPARRTRRIEVIGDSISAGYGNENTTPNCGYLPAEEDATRSYAAFAARALQAELIVQAWSGKGVYRNIMPPDPDTMPVLYGRVLPADAHSPLIHQDYAPHAIIVHLGTNDLFAGLPDAESFKAAYRALLERLHVAHPKAKLLLILSPMITDTHPRADARRTLRSWLVELREQLARQGADTTLVEQDYRADEPWGCHAHPSVRSHARFGAELAAVLHQKLGW